MVVTSYGLNKNLDDEIKKQEKANNGLRYRCAAIKQKEIKTKIAKKAAFKICSLIENLFTHQFLSPTWFNNKTTPNQSPISLPASKSILYEKGHRILSKANFCSHLSEILNQHFVENRRKPIKTPKDGTLKST